MPIEAGGGGILLFLDSDDTLEVNACEEVAKAFASDDIDLCIFKFKFLTEGIETLRDSFFDKSKTCSIDEFERFLLYEKWHNEDLFSLCNKAWKKEVYLRNFEENLKHIQIIIM
ncbi:hypothetical protein LS68_007265 [Helicobacter sp. MIT 05-5293]|uniref:hypothetical protein n=1 Tax=Helicobacter sp. MIT 05-5293 TaxID=1548149 RepID=UPI0010FE0D8D|nr:hypothetical protein [Helicobacter sp. MIT 05-5293]TLD80533.1 hypothetical protein LS68_007265 [Helicobacter sp. MIT 05-5293]